MDSSNDAGAEHKALFISHRARFRVSVGRMSNRFADLRSAVGFSSAALPAR